MIRILFLAAVSLTRPTCASTKCARIDAADQERRFVLIPEFDAAADQLQDLLFRHRPQIVHFSGHGAQGGLFFKDANGQSRLVAPQTLRDLLAGFQTTVRCVVLNACYSQTQAEAIAAVIDSVVGMSEALTDDAARAFAAAFYRALIHGAPLADAVALGRNQLDLQDLPEAHKPQLLAARVDAG
ncbi:MAG: CHAT domain-containing protein [Caldilineaceae bacterium]